MRKWHVTLEKQIVGRCIVTVVVFEKGIGLLSLETLTHCLSARVINRSTFRDNYGALIYLDFIHEIKRAGCDWR